MPRCASFRSLQTNKELLRHEADAEGQLDDREVKAWAVLNGDFTAGALALRLRSGFSQYGLWDTATKWPGWGRWVGLRCRPSPGQALRDDAQDPVGSVEGADAQRGGLAYPQTARILAARHVLWIGLRIPPSRRRT